MSARDDVLARIAEALAIRGAPAPTTVAAPSAAPSPAPPPVPPPSPAAPRAPLERFVERVADYRATVRETTPAGLPALLVAIVRERGIASLVAPAGLPRDWPAAVAAAGATVRVDDPPLAHAELDRIDAVLTTCAVAIAETGTIVLDGGPGQGRRALSLLPDRHLCVVAATDIVADVAGALARLDPRRPLTWVSGPSATSDIELDRVEGVHGPRILDVIVVRDPEADGARHDRRSSDPR